VCSAGGHLTELIQLKEVYEQYDHFFITLKRQDTIDLAKKEKVYFISDPERNPIKFIANLFQSFWILIKEKPNIILSTGAGMAIPVCYIGKIFRSKIIFIESFCRIKEPSLTGKIIYPIADLFLVQWREQLKKYGNKAIYSGSVF
jgi:UDP-N-acetylglucosamine:LPS N-acetylglucosamine transferase